MAGVLDEGKAEVLVRLIDCLEGAGPFTGLWTQTVEHMKEMGYTEEEITQAVDELYEIAGLSR